MAASPTTAITFQNFYSATLTADITNTATDIFLDTVPNGSEGFLVIDPDSTSGREVIYYNSKTATKVVCPSAADGRGQDDTSASAHLTGTLVIMAPIAAYYELLLSLFTTSPQGWTSLSGNFTTPTYNGQHSYDITTSVDQRSVLSPGARFRLTRTVTAPTQCTDLEASSSQYYSKTSPAGMTFTDDFAVSAWVKLESYTAGNATIASRYNGTSGWEFYVDSAGRPQLIGHNAGSGNYSVVVANQSIPLGKWVHIAAQLDMSAFTVSATTSYIMIDGQEVTSAVSRAGTNPTALIQAGNLEIGAANGGTVLFDGKLAQVAIYSAKVTQANIRATISQTLTGSETSLISAYSFNNTINDLNGGNANNLTANGSAVATNVDSPFAQGADAATGFTAGTTDYGIITAVTASTITVQTPEASTIPTTGGISAAYYSTFKAPYGFPSRAAKWIVESVLRVLSNQVAVVSTVYNIPIASATNSGGWQLMVPVGSWKITAETSPQQSNSVGGSTQFRVGLSTSASVMDVTNRTVRKYTNFVAVTEYAVDYTSSDFVTVTTATPYYFLTVTDSGAGTITLRTSADTADGRIYLENAYL